MGEWVGFWQENKECLYYILFVLRVVFFFQAEDGIRDSSVTGVQTCALPILGALRAIRKSSEKRRGSAVRCTRLLVSCQRVFMERSSAGRCSFGFPRRWRKILKRAGTNWRIAAQGGLKRTCDSSPASISDRRRRKSPPWRRDWNPPIRIPTEAAGSDSGRCGKRRSITRRLYFPRSKPCSLWSCLSC